MAPRLTSADIFPGLQAKDPPAEAVVVFLINLQIRCWAIWRVSAWRFQTPRKFSRRKSHDNIRGWLFRVAHNLAWKKRYRAYQDSGARAGVGAAAFALLLERFELSRRLLIIAFQFAEQFHHRGRRRIVRTIYQIEQRR